MTDHFFAQQPSGYRGRRQAIPVRFPKQWAVAALAAAVLFSTGAAATKLHSRVHPAEAITSYTLSANAGVRQFGDSFAEVLW